MVKCSNNSISDVSVVRAHQNSANQKSTQNKLRVENVNFVHGFSPVYYISRIFGLMPFSIVCDLRRGTQKPQVKLLDGMWFLLSISMYISMAITTYVTLSLPRDTSTASFILALGDSMLLIVGLVYSVFIIMFDMYNRFRLTEILNKFITFDRDVRSYFTFNSILFDFVSVRNAFFRCLALEFITITRRKIEEHGYFASYRSQWICRSLEYRIMSIELHSNIWAFLLGSIFLDLMLLKIRYQF